MHCFKVILVLILTAGLAKLAEAQPVFSQYYATGLFLNPAICGIEKDIHFGLNYRSQWSSVNLPFKTFQFSYINPIASRAVKSKHLGGIGASFLHDEAGPNSELVTQSVSIAGTYNFHLNRSGSIIAVGAQFTAMQQQLNPDAFRWSSQYSLGTGFDAALQGESGVIKEQIFTPVLNAGAIWHHTIKNLQGREIALYHGLAVANVQRSNGFFSDQLQGSAIVYKMHGGFSVPVTDKVDVAPNYLLQYQNQLQLNVGTYASYSLNDSHFSNVKKYKVVAGMWYRWEDAIIISTGMATNIWNIGFSYDTNKSALSRSLGNANAYEISMAYKIKRFKAINRFSSPLM
jgi:type IX secretion system PorP/SprF family membrane protein